MAPRKPVVNIDGTNQQIPDGDTLIVGAGIDAAAGVLLLTIGATTATSVGVAPPTTIQGVTVGLGGGALPGNTTLGAKALGSNTLGTENTAIGAFALLTTTVGVACTAVGYEALFANEASDNTAVGYQAMSVNGTGIGNTAAGYRALQANTKGNENVAVGVNTGLANKTGNNNTFVGSLADATADGFENATALGNGATVTASDAVQLGNGSISLLSCQVALTVVSDARDKTDVETLPEALPILADLRPVKYRWDNRSRYDDGVSDGSKKNPAYTTGFLAQELQQVQTTHGADWLDVVYAGDPDRLGVTHERLLPLVVKAAQELAAKVAAAEARADAAEARLAALEAAVTALQS